MFSADQTLKKRHLLAAGFAALLLPISANAATIAPQDTDTDTGAEQGSDQSAKKDGAAKAKDDGTDQLKNTAASAKLLDAAKRRRPVVYRFKKAPDTETRDEFYRLVRRARDFEVDGKTKEALDLLRLAGGYVAELGREADSALLLVRYRQLRIETPDIEWRRVEHRLGDLSSLISEVPLWSPLQLERALSEAELRLEFQPASDEKIVTLGQLKEEMRLITETMGSKFTPDLRARYREFLYALEDELGF